MTVSSGENVTPKTILNEDDGFGVVPSNSESGVGARLREALRRVGTVKQAAERSGVPFGTIQNYLSGRDMKLSNALALADAAGVDLRWLATGEGSINGGLQVFDPLPPAPDQLTPTGYVSIPRYEAHASAGAGAINPSDRIIEQLTVTEEYIRRELRREPKYMALLEVLGDSMDPTLQSGDVIMIDVSVTAVRNSSVFVIRIEEDLLVKRLQRLIDGRIRIISDNKEYPEEFHIPSEASRLDIVGEVVASLTRFRNKRF